MEKSITISKAEIARPIPARYGYDAGVCVRLRGWREELGPEKRSGSFSPTKNEGVSMTDDVIRANGAKWQSQAVSLRWQREARKQWTAQADLAGVRVDRGVNRGRLSDGSVDEPGQRKLDPAAEVDHRRGVRGADDVVDGSGSGGVR